MTASVAIAQSGYVIKSSSGANLRSGAGADFKVVTAIPAGSRVKVLEQGNNGWNKVEYQGQTGYVSATLIEKEGEQQRSGNNGGSSNGGSSQNGSRPSYASNNNNNSNSSKSNRNNSKSGNNRSSSSNSGGQNWGLGLRGGDPAGITLKRYRGNGSALEFVLGRSFRWGYHYDDRFYRYSRFNDRDVYRFDSYSRTHTTALQVHYLLHKDIKGANGLQFYYGGGLQARFTPVTYAYRYKRYYSGKDYEWTYTRERVTDLDLGLDGVLGLEYTFREIPFSIFVDVNAFVEVYDVPFWISGQSGAGLRYNF